jgi:hypothetical protein
LCPMQDEYHSETPLLRSLGKMMSGQTPISGAGNINKPANQVQLLLEAERAIDQKYAELGGKPGGIHSLEPMRKVTGGFAKYYPNGTIWGDIFWSRRTGAHFVHGDIRRHYVDDLSGPESYLGLPTSDELPAGDGTARIMHFEHGAICWHPTHGSWALRGAIHRRWSDMGADRWGLPIADEQPTLDGTGRFNHFVDPTTFKAGKSIFWHPDSGAFEVHGVVGEKYASMGYETSYLGYPTSGELPVSTGDGDVIALFQRGTIEFIDGQARDVPDQMVREALLEDGGVRFKGMLVCKSSGAYGVVASFENDAWVSVRAGWVMALNYQAPDGAVFVASKEASLAGEVTGDGNESATWNYGGFEPRIREHWDELRHAEMTSRLSTTQHVAEMIPFVLSLIPMIIGGVLLVGLIGGAFVVGTPRVRPGPPGSEQPDIEIPIEPAPHGDTEGDTVGGINT